MLASTLRADPCGHGFVQGLSNPVSFVQVEGDVLLLVHGDDLMVEMPAHEETWFESALFSKFDGKRTGKFHSYCNAATVPSWLTRVFQWDPISGKALLEAELEARYDGASRSGD